MGKTIDSYYTITKPGEGFYKEKGSKFLGFALPCDNQEKAKELLEKYRKEHHQACHVCFAWRFGKAVYKDRFSDDGEPNNSAGKPIFGQLIAHNVTNTLVAVVRYYGGTNLGVGGLITAYKTAAKEALENAKIEKKHIESEYKITHTFEDTGNVMSALNSIKANITDQLFENNQPSIIFTIQRSQKKQLDQVFEPFPNVKLTLLKSE